MTVEDLLLSVSEGLNKPLTKGDILSNEIKVSHLKRIDKVFNKGLHYYLDPKFPEVSKDASIFFRKNKFGTELTIGAKKIVNQFAEFHFLSPYFINFLLFVVKLPTAFAALLSLSGSLNCIDL
jgi:hypothetical protein